MVAPQPLEPLVMYLGATPYSASAALVAVREDRQAKDASRRVTPPAGAIQDPEGTTRAAATPTDNQAPQGGALGPAEAPMSDQASGVPSPQGAPQAPTNVGPVDTPALVKQPVYFVSTVLRDSRAWYRMPQKLLLALLVASRKLWHYFQGHPIKVVSAYPLERVLRIPNAAGRVTEWNIELLAF